MQSLLHHFSHLQLLSSNKVSRVDSEVTDLQWEGFLYLRGLPLLAPPPLKRWHQLMSGGTKTEKDCNWFKRGFAF